MASINKMLGGGKIYFSNSVDVCRCFQCKYKTGILQRKCPPPLRIIFQKLGRTQDLWKEIKEGTKFRGTKAPLIETTEGELWGQKISDPA